MDKINNIGPSRFQYRYLARFIIEAVTPLAVGSGEADLLTDAPVALDVNGLPYIPGTSIAGVIRHQLDDQYADSVEEASLYTNTEWGSNVKNQVSGSNIIITEARILDSGGKVVDGMDLHAGSDALLGHYTALPIRQHVRINERGVSTNAGKYDGQVVYAGSRFCFEMEWLAAERDDAKWNQVLSEFLAPSFRLGSGTRCGFGEMTVVDCPLTACLDLRDADQLALYLAKSSELQESGSWKGWQKCELLTPADAAAWDEYQLELSPQDLFLFAAASGDEQGNADTTAVRAQVVEWNGNKGQLIPNQVLIPATSVKGAISHRVAFHYNRLTAVNIDGLQQLAEVDASIDFQKLVQNHVGGKNPAVVALFGTEGEVKERKQVGLKRGNVIFSDVIMDHKDFQEKLVNHVTIDDFTGAAIDGHLFTEEPIFGKGTVLKMKIHVRKSALTDEKVRKALEYTFCDLCEGQLPLGGGVYRGNGLFVGSWKKSE